MSKPKETPEPSWLHVAAEAALARRRIVVHPKYSATEAAEIKSAADAAALAAAQAGGIGGGPAVATPPGPSFNDAVRRQAGV